jgi:hypothetical protein
VERRRVTNNKYTGKYLNLRNFFIARHKKPPLAGKKEKTYHQSIRK